MARRGPATQRAREFDYASLSERLRGRRGEIEETVLARIYAVSDPTASGDPEFVASMREAVAEAVAYGFGVVEEFAGEHRSPPRALPAQAARAARSGVSLDT